MLAGLFLHANQLSGTFPKEIIINNTKLEGLYYGNNTNISGTLYSDIGYALPNLRSLSVMNCNLSGEIPESIFELSNLQILNLQNNSFYGSISTRFGALSKLSHLFLAGNSFRGSIPSEIGNIPYLSK